MYLKTLLLISAFCATAPAAVIAAVSGDNDGIPRQVNLIDTNQPSNPIRFNLDGALTGGLTYLPAVQKFFTIYQQGIDSFLASFDRTNPILTNSSLALNPGFWLGLTAASDSSFYAWYTDGSAPLSLYELNLETNSSTQLLTGPDAGFGGMTRTPSGNLTALFTNAEGSFQLHNVDLATSTITPFGNPLPGNANGGLVYLDNYYAITNNFSGQSSLVNALSGTGAPIGGGYFYSGATVVDDTNPVPEPSTFAAAGLGLALLSLRRKALLLLLPVLSFAQTYSQPVREVEKPHKSIYQHQDSIAFGFNCTNCDTLSFPALPANKRLVLEHVSIHVQVPPGGAFFCRIGPPGGPFFALPAPQRSGDYMLISLPFRMYFDLAPIISCSRNESSNTQWGGSAGISGYLADR